MRVFIENEAGSRTKHHHDEKRLVPLGTEQVARAYPYPYGFVVGTTGGDGDNVDCFVITATPLHTGDLVECRPVGLLEQIEGGDIDHNVLAVPLGEAEVLPPEAVPRIAEFILHFREHQPEVTNTVGRLLDRDAAVDYVERRRDADA